MQNNGFEIQIIEARERIGGRIHTLNTNNAQIEMGATWFNDIHENFKKLLEELQLQSFEQFMQGTSFFEPFSVAPAQEINIPQNSPSYRVKGGTFSVIEALKNLLIHVPIHLNETVVSLNFEEEKAVITTTKQVTETDYVISTLPMALFANEITVTPSLPEDFNNLALKTHTWMQDSIKVAFAYANPFWREADISGTLFSNVGPMTEFYDQSNAELAKFALCGFISSGMEMYTPKERLEKLKTQLVKVFWSGSIKFYVLSRDSLGEGRIYQEPTTSWFYLSASKQRTSFISKILL